MNVGFLLPYSRLHESEADRIGLTLMARAGYDPQAAIPFWERMNKQEGQRPPQFLSTHPAPETRIADIKKYLPEALPYFEKKKNRYGALYSIQKLSSAIGTRLTIIIS
jgi:predicted Zn-dependent protease